MHRDDAQTVSFTWVTVDDAGVNMYYAADSPCRSLAGESFSLALCGLPQTQCASGLDGRAGRVGEFSGLPE
jgi:hypothetical protein